MLKIYRAVVLSIALLVVSPVVVSQALAEPVMSVEIQLPNLSVDPYHRPYLAVWLETPDRKAVATLAVWREDDQWLKDLRQWWRKVGRRAGPEIDSVTRATRKPGKYVITWDGRDHAGVALLSGEYLLNIEAAREEGGRSYIRQKIALGVQGITTTTKKDEFTGAVITVH